MVQECVYSPLGHMTSGAHSASSICCSLATAALHCWHWTRASTRRESHSSGLWMRLPARGSGGDTSHACLMRAEQHKLPQGAHPVGPSAPPDFSPSCLVSPRSSGTASPLWTHKSATTVHIPQSHRHTLLPRPPASASNFPSVMKRSTIRWASGRNMVWALVGSVRACITMLITPQK